MLVRFSFKNYKTFRDEAELSLVATPDTTRREENVIGNLPFHFNLLKSAVIYGANASGKSKMMEALQFMKKFVITSSVESQKGEIIDVEPFLLNTNSSKSNSEFEIIFIYKNQLFRYGFEVSTREVVAEWLFHRPKTKEVQIFFREGDKFEVHPRLFPKGTTLAKENLVRNNALMLSVAAQFNDLLAGEVIDWFRRLRIISGIKESVYAGFTLKKSRDSNYKIKILDLLRSADLGIDDITFKKYDVNNLPLDFPPLFREIIQKSSLDKETEVFSDPETVHRTYDDNQRFQGTVKFSMEKHESHGTQKFFYLTGPILDAMENGYILVVDELDANIHPNLVKKIISLFNSQKTNPHNAQLIFNTHNTNLLNDPTVRRDQVWFVEKDRYGAAKLYSLAEFKSSVRKEEQFEKNYIRGKYGAIPVVNDLYPGYGNKVSDNNEDAQ